MLLLAEGSRQRGAAGRIFRVALRSLEASAAVDSPHRTPRLPQRTPSDPRLAEKTLTIDRVDPLLLYGFNDAHLRKIEAAFTDARVTARGNQVFLRGAPEAVERAERVLQELQAVLARNDALTERDVETVLDLASVSGGIPRSDAADVLVFTPSGGMVRAKTPGQHRLVEAARQNDIVFAVGPAGTGKTYTAVALAVAALKGRHVKRLVISRPAVEAGESLGFLPGDFREKIDPYLRPLYDALEDMLPREKLLAQLDQHAVEIVPLAYMRGRTLSNAFVILDEAQNATAAQMKMFLTRLGPGSRAIVTGDLTQTDLPRRTDSGLAEAVRILRPIEGIAFVQFDRGDVVRHRLVKEIIEAYEKDEDARDGAPQGDGA
jgi:phosphate starvation-inducible protein PhoH and related proteins